MKFTKTLLAGVAGACIAFSGNVFAQPVFSHIYPNGTNLFQSSPTFSFSASSSFNITNIQVQLTGTPLAGGSPVLQLLGPTTGLTAVGFPGATFTASCPLKTNLTYAVIITATDNNGVTSSTNVAFNTIVPAYIWEAEDYDYTNGLYFDNPQTNAYAGLSGIQGVDVNNVHTGNQSSSYRPDPNNAVTGGPGGMGNENCGDTIRLAHIGKQDYDIGYNIGGAYSQYTRHYPVGTYYVFMRAASTGQQTRNADFSVTAGTAVLTESSGTIAFKCPLTGANQTYNWGPLLDGNGQLVTFTSDGSASTTRLTTDQGSYNANFFMLMPTNISAVPVGSISFGNFYPDGVYQMEATNQFVFTMNSTVGIDPNSVILRVSATNLPGVGSQQLVSTLNGLTLSGTATSYTGSLVLNTDTVYTVFIQATDLNGVSSSTNLVFDTVNPSYYTWEAEDYNYQNGQFIDNPQTNAYDEGAINGGFDAVANVDAFYNGGGGHANNRLGLSTEGASDLKRPQFQVVDPLTGANYLDFDCGNSSGNSWGNYTRTFPAGIYNIYERGANGGGANSDNAQMGTVTPTPANTTSQTVTKLGTFSGPATGGWQVYTWIPLKLANGTLVQWTADGTPNTLRVTTDSGSVNENYYMLVPANTNVILAPFISAFTPDGSTMFQEAPSLSFIAHSQVGVSASNIKLNLNGMNVSGLITSGSPTLLNVSYPVQTNKFYTAIVTITDSHGSAITTNTFDTFDPATYTFEAEDYDYTSGGVAGQFIDNPQVDAYAGLGGTEGIDEKDDNHLGAAYRPIAGVGAGAFGLNIGGFEFETPSGDQLRPQYVSSGDVDYNIGFNDGGNWGNYTRTYPAGTYNIYMRSASPNNGPNGTANAASVSLVTSNWGTTNQTTTTLGTFLAPYTGDWHKFNWTPLMSGGSMVQWVSTGTTNTLRVTVVNGNYNVDFYALVPADTNTPVIANVSPSGAYKYQGGTTLSFNASAPGGLSGSQISVVLTGTNLFGQVYSNTITTANGLNVSGTSTSLNASFGLSASTLYTAVITVTALNGETTTSTVTFDTIAPAMTFEAEDWNYTDTNTGDAGLFFDNPQTNAYINLVSTPGIDYSNSVNQGNANYRPQGLETEGASDNVPPRVAYATGQQDYDVGFNNGGSGDWANYTRTFPAGAYNIFLRASNGNGSGSDSASMYWVTSAATTASQTTVKLGTFSVPTSGAGNWQVYGNVPLIDSDGNYAEFVGGSAETLRVTTDNGNYNANYYFLVPAETVAPVNPPHLKVALAGTNLVVSFLTRTNATYVLQYKSDLLAPAWTPVWTNTGTALWLSITNPMSGANGFYSLKQ